jgi:ATP-dependent Lon protease
MNIPPALMDRMEVIKIAGYTEDEKLNIANRYLIPKSKKESGLKQHECTIEDDAIVAIIRTHTREAGVRSLERQITKICRKVVKEMLMNDNVKACTITPDNLEDYLGVKKYRYGTAETQGSIGQATGLAWTEVGGDLLKIEAAAIPGKGKIIRTGQLGDVMQESVQAAITVVRELYDTYSIPKNFNEKYDMHIHVPEGATPKDGPSAGIGMATAMVSVLAEIPIRHDVAMTGEITLRGEVLPIGGLKEKLLAARRGGISTVLIPEENVRELKEIADNVKEGLEIIPVKWIKEVLRIALENPSKAHESSAIDSKQDHAAS